MELDNTWSKFSREDPFNNNWVEGYICHKHGDEYGALYIEKVNHKDSPQLIMATPKISYPFDRNGNWNFPKAVTIERYEKLDGTNIFAFLYHDVKGNKYLSYKTRLVPFLQSSKFGPWLDMWKELLKNDPRIDKMSWKLKKNLSFEMWGARNPHLVQYKTPSLKASLLFIRDGRIIKPPSSLELQSWFGNDWDNFSTPFKGRINKDYVWNYQQAQEEAEKTLQEIEGGYLGSEGEVWYLLDESGKWNLYKCKPSTIEAIHWASGGIGKNIIIAACFKAFENFENPTPENIQTILLEDYSIPEVEKKFNDIIKYRNQVQGQFEFQLKILEEYKKLNMSILNQKQEVMRALSGKFTRQEMGRVFSIVWNKEIK